MKIRFASIFLSLFLFVGQLFGQLTTLIDSTAAQLMDFEDLQADRSNIGTATLLGKTYLDATIGGTLVKIITAFENDRTNVLDYGATRDDATDDATAFQSAIDAIPDSGGVLFFPPGEYTFSSTDSLYGIPSKTKVVMYGATIRLSQADLFMELTSKKDVEFCGGRIVGQGSGGNGSDHVFKMTSCEGIKFYGVKIDSSSQESIRFEGTDYSTVQGCDIRHSFNFAILDKSGIGNTYDSNWLIANGDTSLANPQGRGVNLWMTTGSRVTNNIILNSSEYGIRLYSQDGDVVANETISVVNNYVKDSGKIDIFLYNESDSVRNVIVSNNTIHRTPAADSLKGDPNYFTTAISLQGQNIKCDNNHVYREDSVRVKRTGIFGYDLDDSSISNNFITGFEYAIALSSTSKCDNLDIIYNRALICKNFLDVYGDNMRIEHNRATFTTLPGTGGTTTAVSGDNGIAFLDGSDNNQANYNFFDGFYEQIYTAYDNAFLVGNRTVNSVSKGFRSTLSDWGTYTLINNFFDSIQSGGNFIGNSYVDIRNTITQIHLTAPPTGGTWNQGDIAWNFQPVAGESHWMNTTNGTPGTWIEFGHVYADSIDFIKYIQVGTHGAFITAADTFWVAADTTGF